MRELLIIFQLDALTVLVRPRTIYLWRMAASLQVGEIEAALAEGGAEARDAAYGKIEAAVRTASTAHDGGKEEAVAFVIACVKPLIVSVLCAPASRVDEAEWVRASVLLYEMCKADMVMVCAETHRKTAAGIPLYFSIFAAPDTVFANTLAKEPDGWTRGDAVVVAANHSVSAATWAPGYHCVLREAEWDEGEWMSTFNSIHPLGGDNPQPADRYSQLMLLCMDLVRREVDTQPDGIVAGAAGILGWGVMANTQVFQALFEAGFVDVLQSTLTRWNPMERIGLKNVPATAILVSMNHMALEAPVAGVDMIQPLLDAGMVDISISSLVAYQMMNNPSQASVNAMCWGGLMFLETLFTTGSPGQSEPIVAKLRSAGVDCFRYVLDHPLWNFVSFLMGTPNSATNIAAQVWGRDDDGGGLSFKQQDIEKIVDKASHRGDVASLFPMLPTHGQALLSLCVSDTNKELLLTTEGLIPLLVDSLLLDPEHPRKSNAAMLGTTDWDGAKGPVQRDFAEAIAQLAMFPPGREALQRDPVVAEALQQVAAEGWTQEARQFAKTALLAMSDRQPEAIQVHQNHDHKHIMLSYQWDVQVVVRRVVSELQVRGYRTWFGEHGSHSRVALIAICTSPVRT